jgi:uncharacterized glyoxalase superfamily protein PhnB
VHRVAILTNLRPMLEVDDMRKTMWFWCDVLGFSVTASMGAEGEPPGWCNVTRDGVSIMFTWEPEHVHDDGSSHRSEAQLAGSLYFNTDDVNALYTELHGTDGISTRSPRRVFQRLGVPTPPSRSKWT